MTTQTPESIALFYTEGSSDKEYRVELRQVDGGLWMTLGFNGRRGSTLKEQKKTQEPVDYATAKAEYDKVVTSKMKGGYTPDQSGAVYQSVEMKDRFSGFVPQLLNSVRKPDVLEALINNPTIWAQEKHDGERRPVRLNADKVEGLNKEGVIVGLPMNVVDELRSLKAKNLLVDGEIMGERYVVFDLLEHNDDNLRELSYAKRLDKLTDLLGAATLNTVELVVTAKTPEEKRKLFDALRDHQAEGLAFKDSTAHYAPGRPESGGAQHKWKFIETCTVRVAARNGTKRSVAVECLDNNGSSCIALGNVTIPANFDIPKVGAIVNVEYLYLYKGGSLFQPVFKGERSDQALPDTLSKFKTKSDQIFTGGVDQGEPTASTKKKAAP